MSIGENSSSVPLTRAEQETQTEAERLTEQIEAALAAVAVRTTTTRKNWKRAQIVWNAPRAISPQP